MKIGDKVTYTPEYGEYEKGIIKSFSDSGFIAFVVYKCDNDWKNYQNYTGASTNIEDLILGWN